MFRNLLCD